MKLHYFDRHHLSKKIEEELNLTFQDNVESLVKVCDVVTINCPLHPETENGASTQVFCAVTPKSLLENGRYYANCHIELSSKASIIAEIRKNFMTNVTK